MTLNDKRLIVVGKNRFSFSVRPSFYYKIWVSTLNLLTILKSIKQFTSRKTVFYEKKVSVIFYSLLQKIVGAVKSITSKQIFILKIQFYLNLVYMNDVPIVLPLIKNRIMMVFYFLFNIFFLFYFC